jgi:hypothetical protein
MPGYLEGLILTFSELGMDVEGKFLLALWESGK